MNQVSLDTQLVVPDDVIFRELDGEAIILNLATGMYFGLDEIGTRLWALVTESGTLRHAVDVMAGEYERRSAGARRRRARARGSVDRQRSRAGEGVRER